MELELHDADERRGRRHLETTRSIVQRVRSGIWEVAKLSQEKLEKNKAIVRRLFEELFIPQVSNFAVLDEIVHENYVQHNPMAGQGREGLRKFLMEVYPKIAKRPPILKCDMIAEGDLVVQKLERPDGMLIDIVRIKDGWLVEHWDAFRPAPGAERIPGF